PALVAAEQQHGQRRGLDGGGQRTESGDQAADDVPDGDQDDGQPGDGVHSRVGDGGDDVECSCRGPAVLAQPCQGITDGLRAPHEVVKDVTQGLTGVDQQVQPCGQRVLPQVLE